MKINAVPIEAYRQAAGVPLKRNEAPTQEQTVAHRPERSEKVTISSSREAAAPSVQAPVAPSLLEGVLSPEEKTELLRHFARFGDARQESRIYGTGSRMDSGGAGIRVDLKA